MNDVITYAPSTTIALTRSCANRCLYCGFRRDDDGLLRFEEIAAIAHRAREDGKPEVLVMAGENADRVASVRSALASLGFTSMVQWAKRVCEYLLEQELLPHVNIGWLGYAELKELKDVSASMGLMMEGDYGSLGAVVQPQKDFALRLQNLEWAGQLEIPFTTGILIGMGESQKDRIRSMQAIIGCARRHGHVQEIILQNYVPNRNSRISAQRVSVKELKEIIDIAREALPEVSLQIPPNLNSDWPELLRLGADDLGGISKEADLVNPERPWPAPEEMTEILHKNKYTLRKRLPIYARCYKLGWCSEKVGQIISGWIQSDHDYQYYTQ